MLISPNNIYISFNLNMEKNVPLSFIVKVFKHNITIADHDSVGVNVKFTVFSRGVQQDERIS